MATPKLALPQLDLARIQRYCDGKIPPRLHEQIRIDMEVRGRSVTILECRPPWTPAIGPRWTRMPVARLRYLVGRGVWLLDWRDRNERWHLYDDIEPSRYVQPLLVEIEEDPTSVFWG